MPSRVEALQEEIKKLQQQLKKGAAGDLAGAADKLLAAAVGGERGEGHRRRDAGRRRRSRCGQQVDRLRQKAGSAVVVVGWTRRRQGRPAGRGHRGPGEEGRHAGKLVGEVAKVVGGKGGGRKDMAQAGGKDPAKLGEALQAARKLAAEQLGA